MSSAPWLPGGRGSGGSFAGWAGARLDDRGHQRPDGTGWDWVPSGIRRGAGSHACSPHPLSLSPPSVLPEQKWELVVLGL